jgi:hypothetical protein
MAAEFEIVAEFKMAAETFFQKLILAVLFFTKNSFSFQ